MDPIEQKRAAKKFVARWKELPKKEDQDCHRFWYELVGGVLGVSNPTYVLDTEKYVYQGNIKRRIDVYSKSLKLIIEQKSCDVDLDKPEVRSKLVGEETPYQQAKWYADNLDNSERPRWLITCNFIEFRIYDLENSNAPYQSFTLDELPDNLNLLSMFHDGDAAYINKDTELNIEKAELVGKLYDELSKQYLNIETDENEQRSLNILIVRLVFLFYAEDAGLMGKDLFIRYLREYPKPQQTRQAMLTLFKTLNMPDGTGGTENERDPYLADFINAFPYVNGGLFADEIVIPQFTLEARLAIEGASSADWSCISPTIFGAAFESTLNPETRRSGGIHFTSIKSIHKVIDPLFLNGLKRELDYIEALKVPGDRRNRLYAFKAKLAKINVFDPACGSGNFLTESYLELRKLENRVLRDLQMDGQLGMDLDGSASAVQVSIDQFHGIEINDFAVSVAKTALWIAESQMLQETAELIEGYKPEFLPLRSQNGIVEGNALTLDWNSVLPAEKCTYIAGNPPFIGARNQTKEQKAEIAEVFHGAKNSGNVDYVAGWYMKAAEYIGELPVHCAFVSTNSICQGEQVANIWKPIYDMGIGIDFAYRTFVWNSEATDQAHVHVVIVGFSRFGVDHRYLFDANGSVTEAKNINAYLSDAPDSFIWNRSQPLCSLPKIGIGNKPIDGGNYLFKPEELQAFLNVEPGAEKFIHPWLGSEEFIKGKERFVLWLGDAAPQELINLPKCRERISAVREFRLASKSAPTQKLAETPARFHVENMPEGTSVIVPRVSSERRRYIPLGFVGPEALCSDSALLIPNATLYHFGVLHSQMHNAWMRTVCGRLKSDYRYSGGVVYNNFPWPGVNKTSLGTPVADCVSGDVKQEIERCAQAVLDARAELKGLTIAQMYDPENADIVPGLVAAHKALDAAVETAYGVDFNGDEEKIVAHLFELYAELTEGD